MDPNEALKHLIPEVLPRFVRLTRNRNAAEELIQIASEEWWRKYQSTGHMPSIGFLWLIGLYRHRSNHQKRKRQDKVERQYSCLRARHSQSSSLKSDEIDERIARVRAILQDLPAKQREVIERIIIHSEPRRTVALEMGCCEATIRTLLHRGLIALRIRVRRNS